MIRPAFEEDAPKIAELHIQVWKDAYKEFIPEQILNTLSDEQFAAVHLNRINSITHQVIIAASGQNFEGFVETNLTTGEISALYVKESKKGIGSALLRAALDNLKSLGFRTATLWVIEDNLKARSFYEKRGWFPTGERRVSPNRHNLRVPEVKYRVMLQLIKLPE